jgi:hypothetical protein
MPPAGTELKGCSHPQADCDLQDGWTVPEMKGQPRCRSLPLALTLPTAHPFCSLRCPGWALPISVPGRPAISRPRLVIAGSFEVPLVASMTVIYPISIRFLSG